jgi:hypothetical protein
MSIMDYCEYNARRAWAKRSPSAEVRAGWTDAARTEPEVPALKPEPSTRVEEHAPDSTSGVHVRAVHEAMLRAREGE